jgi:hypothetical protein
VGEWKDNMAHGIGIFTFSSGEQLGGTWREGDFLY